jgi:hypothetical protein
MDIAKIKTTGIAVSSPQCVKLENQNLTMSECVVSRASAKVR